MLWGGGALEPETGHQQWPVESAPVVRDEPGVRGNRGPHGGEDSEEDKLDAERRAYSATPLAPPPGWLPPLA